MTGETAGSVVVYALALVLPLSALVARRMRLATALKMALAWGAVFAIALLLARQFDWT